MRRLLVLLFSVFIAIQATDTFACKGYKKCGVGKHGCPGHCDGMGTCVADDAAQCVDKNTKD
jgi:hypothetical protein